MFNDPMNEAIRYFPFEDGIDYYYGDNNFNNQNDYFFFQNNNNNIPNEDISNNSNNQNRNYTRLLQSQVLENTISLKASFSCLRLSLLYLCYFIENYRITSFLATLIIYLLIYEFLILSNCIIMKTFLLYKRTFSPLDISFPKVCIHIDMFNTMIYFSWFVYGCYCIMVDAEGVSISLDYNPLLMYYITVLIMFGFFEFSKIIFYIIFFICFFPCIAYVYISEVYEEYKTKRNTRRLQEELEEIGFDEYLEKKSGIDNTKGDADVMTCAICTEDFTNKDKVIVLKCSNKHVFHSSCLRQWVENKAICPICRYDLIGNDGNEEQEGDQNVPLLEEE